MASTRFTTAPDDRQPVLINEDGTLTFETPQAEELLEVWQNLQAVPSYVERMQRNHALFDTERN
jgi:hypothetical protein